MQPAAVDTPRAHRGRPLSEEHKAKLRERAIARWAAAPTATPTGQMPPVLLRLELVDARRAGATFEDAWPDAVSSATAGLGRARLGWCEALEQTRPAWAAAYRHDEGQACWSALAYSRI
jgi:hypothetical protein